MKKILSYITIILLTTLIVVPLNAKTISFSFGQEFTSNFFNSDGQAKGLAPGTKMGFNLYFNEALSVGFVSVSGNNEVSWDESYLEFIYHIFDDPGVGITFGAGQTTSNSKISNRLGITTTAFKNTKNDFFSNLTLSIEAGFREDIKEPRIIFGLGTTFGF